MDTNKKLAKIFYEYSEVLSLGNGDRFKIVAYEKASQVLANLGESVKTIYDKEGIGGLKKIEGVGEGISEKIEEYIKTGRIAEIEKGRKKISNVLLDVLNVPGIGPKNAEKLVNKFSPKNLDDLARKLKAANNDKYFKQKTRENFIRGIGVYKGLGSRMLLTEAMPIAESIVSEIEKMSFVDKVDFVGSLRRWKETIGDIDLIASTKNPEKLIENFSSLSEVEKIITKGKTKSTVIHNAGCQIDLEVLPADEYGSLLQHFTGSKDHNIALRTYAQTKGMSISEHGIKKGKRLIKCTREQEVYATLGMQYIEPELREDRGEIDAALAHKLPKLVEVKQMKGDFHVHSNWSDGVMTIDEITAAAVKMGYSFIAISDHTKALGIAGGLDERKFNKREREIIKARKKVEGKVKILSSAEVDIRKDGDLDLNDETLKKFDIVTASIHSSFLMSKDKMTKRLLRAIEHKDVNIIGHPTGRLLNKRESYEADWDKIFNACIKNKVALEINSFPIRLDLKDSLVFEARKKGVKFVISTDAHRPEHLNNMIYGVSVARRGWCNAENILNTSNNYIQR